MLDGAKHAVFDAEVTVVFEEDDPVAGGEGAFAVSGLESEFANILTVPTVLNIPTVSTVRTDILPVAAPLSVYPGEASNIEQAFRLLKVVVAKWQLLVFE
ncbi:hypothetical protein [Agrobacterium pusense]|jgi:hypothetical protein|uniref:hypothetical protein n=1 Tax=Agrobacterium pusense TaxID=648995 RepID=UPI00245343C9|nr:hypothetical protein [Agrobacterium pusense]